MQHVVGTTFGIFSYKLDRTHLAENHRKTKFQKTQQGSPYESIIIQSFPLQKRFSNTFPILTINHGVNGLTNGVGGEKSA